VQAVKDQGSCSGSWAFGAIGAQEAMWAINNRRLYNLSEQNLIDCVAKASGCLGGNPGWAFDYVIRHQAGHFMPADRYPFEMAKRSCRYDPKDALTTVVDWGIAPGDERALAMSLFEYGPHAASIDSRCASFSAYKSGIYDEPECTNDNPNHVVLIVGYGINRDKDFWLVKNSWGRTWGEDGYIRMVRNNGGQCAIATSAYAPLSFAL
jgi:C1A family cysteine protease